MLGTGAPPENLCMLTLVVLSSKKLCSIVCFYQFNLCFAQEVGCQDDEGSLALRSQLS